MLFRSEEGNGSQIDEVQVENNYETNVDDQGGEHEYENTQDVQDDWGDASWGAAAHVDTVANHEETDGNSSPTITKKLAGRLPNARKIFGPSLNSEVEEEEHNQRDDDSVTY